MVKIIEVQQQNDNVLNYQSRIVEYDSFQEYLQSINEKSLPRTEDLEKHCLEVHRKHVDYEKQVVTFMYEHYMFNRWLEFTHFAQVIE